MVAVGTLPATFPFTLPVTLPSSSAAVIVPALKLPEASRATSWLAVLALAAPWTEVPPPARCVSTWAWVFAPILPSTVWLRVTSWLRLEPALSTRAQFREPVPEFIAVIALPPAPAVLARVAAEVIFVPVSAGALLQDGAPELADSTELAPGAGVKVVAPAALW